MSDFVDIVSSLGFPIAVAVFALWNSHQHEKYLQGVLDNTLKENTNAVNKLSDMIEQALTFMNLHGKGGGSSE